MTHPEPQIGKIIALRTGIGYSYLRKLMTKLINVDKTVVKTKTGYVLSGPVTSTEVELLLENIVVVSKGNIAQVWPTTQVTPLVRKDKSFGGSIRKDLFFRAWQVHIQEFPNGTVHIQLGAKGKKGLTFLDWLQFCGWFEGLYPRIPLATWHVKNWEFNHDFTFLRLDGAKSITFQAFTNDWLKLYQKPKVLRLESRIKCDISVPEAIELMSTIAQSLAKRGLVEVKEVQVK